MRARSPDRLIDCAVGDAFAIPARGKLRIGADPSCAIQHERVREDRVPHRLSFTLELSMQGDDVVGVAREGSMLHFDTLSKVGRRSMASSSSTRKPKVVNGLAFGPTTELRLQIEPRVGLDVGQRVERIRHVLVDHPPDAPSFTRRGVVVDDERAPCTVIVAVGPAVARARTLVVAGPRSPVTVLSRIDGGVFLLVLDDQESVGAHELFTAMHFAGERVEPALLLFVVERLLDQASATRSADVQGSRIRLRDGQPLLRLWARTSMRPTTAARLLKNLGPLGPTALRLKVADDASAADVAAQLRQRRTLDDDEACSRLCTLLRVFFPFRVEQHRDFQEQTALLDPNAVATWTVSDPEPDLDLDLILDRDVDVYGDHDDDDDA
ncbi:MAG: hypothetical protein Q8O67_13620 [Deltaproteobacteria bacterium]|nr:hypothetical protein [Deltaproteobacteria bacterium]